FRFSLFDAPSGGTLVAPPRTFDDLQVSGGFFTVDLDFGLAAFTGGARWLQIEVRQGAAPTYTTLPIQRVAPSPFALALGLPVVQSETNLNPLLSLTNVGYGSGAKFAGAPYQVPDVTLNYGVIGETSDSRSNAAGVQGKALSASGQVIGVEGVATNSGL